MSIALEKEKERVKYTATKGLRTLPKMLAPGHKHTYDVFNAQFAAEDQTFKSACSKAGVKPTARQASKWRNNKGSAFKNKV